MLFRLARLLRATGREILVLWYAVRHPATPLLTKLGAALIALYVLSPLDFIPDWFLLLGWADDVTLLALIIPALLKLAPEHALLDARAAADNFLFRRRS